MKVKLPKELKGVKFPKILTIDMNDFDIDVFLPTLFYTILSQGRGKAKRTNDPEAIQGYIDKLSHNHVMQGFDDRVGRKVLEHLVRTTLITTGGIGRAKQGEQITSIVPYTLLAHKPGFPLKGSRHRGADTFIYQALRENMHRADRELLEAVKIIFGRGVNIGDMPDLGGSYDGKTELDTLTRLSIAFLDGFDNTRTGLSREKSEIPACPKLADELATDLLRYLFEYYKRMPSQAFTYNLLALINFELFNYTLKLVYAINELVQNPETLPSAMRDPLEPSTPQLYLDFTQDVRGRSHEMAKACVRRDIEAYQQFLYSNVLLRLLDSYTKLLSFNKQRKVKIDAILDGSVSGPFYLQGLLFLRDDPTLSIYFETHTNIDMENIRKENAVPNDVGDDVDEEELSWLDDIANVADTDIERLVNLLVEGQRDSALQHFVKWYWSVGGIKKTHGLLAGSTRSRASWRYAPSNDLLAVLVQVAAARLSSQGIQSIRLQEFLQFLEKRYGILIDRPPDMFKGAEYIAAAHDNLRAMQNRLRQMGIFRDLSDDFTIQRLHPPYTDITLKTVEA
ncbi:MAG TPA: hypothetical protein VNG51_20140 [Ktedonobacteraceae bacterium]|nr:hypothetical protein [Ktedonobacteraceae bacterium]